MSFIIVMNYDRFSRSGSGASQFSKELQAMGITVKSVTQDIDTSTASGRLQENFFHLLNNFDNRSKSDRTMINTREVMLNGYRPYATPLGYRNLKEKHRACFHEYIITNQGKELKKAFHLKAEGKLTNKEICHEIRRRGLAITEKNFRFVLSNPFYAGCSKANTSRAIITLETFLNANELLGAAVNTGMAKQYKQEDVPLKIFAREAGSGYPFTAFRQKGIWYYKARGKDVRMTINAQRCNEAFTDYPKHFEYRKTQKEKLKQKLLAKLKVRLASSLEETVQLKKRISEIKTQVEDMEERYALGSLFKELYEKYRSKFEGESKALEAKLAQSGFESSNLEKAVEKALAIAQTISGAWVAAGYEGKQKLQYLVFPEGICYDKENSTVQTERVNTLFGAIPPPERTAEDNKKAILKRIASNLIK